MCDNVGGSGEDHAERNKADGKGQEPYDSTDLWAIKHKTTNEQTQDTDNRMGVTTGEVGRGERRW